MDQKKIYLTKERLEELRQELEGLVSSRRPQVLERVSTARNMGDLSENAEYVAAREELSFIDGRIDELEQILKQVVLISKNGVKNSKEIELGSSVALQIKGKNENYMIVGEWEANPAEKKISHQSPLGKALIGKKAGDKVEIEAPAGKVLYTIVSVS